MSSPLSLPSLVLMSEYTNDWSLYVRALYGHFSRDFYGEPRLSFQGRPVFCARDPVYDGKDAGFWHIISEGKIEADRIPDLRRCERICWPAAILACYPQPELKGWRQPNRGESRLAVSLGDFSYVVILTERSARSGPFYRLITAFHVEQEHRRNKLARECFGCPGI
jgi:hypothetical protein